MSLESPEKKGSISSDNLQQILQNSERFKKKQTGLKFLRVFDNHEIKAEPHKKTSSEKLITNYEKECLQRQIADQKAPKYSNLKISHSKNQKTLGELQSSFEKKLEKIKSLNIPNSSKSTNFSLKPQRSTSVKKSHNLEDIFLRNAIKASDFEKTQKSKTEIQEPVSFANVSDFRSYMEENGQNFSFKGSPRDQHIKVQDQSEERNEFSSLKCCKNHNYKMAKYTIFIDDAPLLCSSCAIKYANAGFKLKSIFQGEDLSLEQIDEKEEVEEEQKIKRNFTKLSNSFKNKVNLAKVFYSKQSEKLEQAFNSIYTVLDRQKDEAKKSISFYEEKTIERLTTLETDFNEAYKEYLRNKNKLSKLKASITLAKNEKVSLYKVKPDTDRIKRLIKQISPLYYVYPVNKQKAKLNKTEIEISKDEEHLLSLNATYDFRFQASLPQNNDSTLEKSLQRQEKQHREQISKERNDSEISGNKTNLGKNQSLKNFTKLESPQNGLEKEMGYFVFDDTIQNEIKAIEKRSSLSSPNFVGIS